MDSIVCCRSIDNIVRMSSLCIYNCSQCMCVCGCACACECIIFQLFLKMDSAVAVAVAVTVDVIHVFDSELGFSHHFPSIAANDLICAQVHLHSVLRALPFSTSITRTQYILSRRSTYIRNAKLRHQKLCASERQLQCIALHTGPVQCLMFQCALGYRHCTHTQANTHRCEPFIHTCASSSTELFSICSASCINIYTC